MVPLFDTHLLLMLPDETSPKAVAQAAVALGTGAHRPCLRFGMVSDKISLMSRSPSILLIPKTNENSFYGTT